jgi:hypothetical protein
VVSTDNTSSGVRLEATSVRQLNVNISNATLCLCMSIYPVLCLHEMCPRLETEKGRERDGRGGEERGLSCVRHCLQSFPHCDGPMTRLGHRVSHWQPPRLHQRQHVCMCHLC